MGQAGSPGLAPSFRWAINLCVCAHLCLSVHLCACMHCTCVQGLVVGRGMIPTISSFSFVSGVSLLEAPHTNPSFPSIPDAPGAIPKVFPHLRNPGFLTWNADLLECAVRIYRIKRPHPLTAHPHACSPAAPVHLLLPLL